MEYLYQFACPILWDSTTQISEVRTSGKANSLLLSYSGPTVSYYCDLNDVYQYNREGSTYPYLGIG